MRVKRTMMSPQDRLIVAADFEPPDEMPLNVRIAWVEEQVVALAMALKGLGIYLKVNTALRAVGYRLIEIIHAHGLRAFADLKLIDILKTLQIDGKFLLAVQPEILTVMADANAKGMSALRLILPRTEVIAVTVLTGFDDLTCCETHHGSVPTVVRRFAGLARKARMSGVVSAPTEATMVRAIVGQRMTINAANIRPAWAVVAGDDQNQNRARTPAEAMVLGVDRNIVGRPVNKAKSPREAAIRTLDEIDNAL